MKNFRINGLIVDADAIGKGLYGIICDKGEEAIVAFGMIPKWSIDLLQKSLREKIVSTAAVQRGVTVEAMKPFLDEKEIKRTMAEIEHQVVLGIYSAASAAGRMVC